MDASVVTTDAEVPGGEPVSPGTRVPVKSLFDHLEAGDAFEDLLRGFPSVPRAQAVAVWEEAGTQVLTGGR